MPQLLDSAEPNAVSPVATASVLPSTTSTVSAFGNAAAQRGGVGSSGNCKIQQTKPRTAELCRCTRRLPSTEGSKRRDYNRYVFTNWLAGGGIKGGVTHGESDQWGYKPLDRSNPTQVHDIDATILHLLGIDHTRLTVRHDGIDRRLTDVHSM